MLLLLVCAQFTEIYFTVTVVVLELIVSALPYAGSVARGYVLLETFPSIEHVNVNASLLICKLSPTPNP